MKVQQGEWRESMLSALFDGEAQADEVARCLDALEADDVVNRWCDYQQVQRALQGDLMGSSAQAFVADFRTRLAQQPLPMMEPVQAKHVKQAVANDGVFRWKLVAGLASCAAVGVLAWSFLGGTQQVTGAAPILAQGTATTGQVVTFAAPPVRVQGFASVPVESASVVGAVSAPQQVMLRDPALDEFLQAHGARAGGVALGNASGFMRNATYGKEAF